jgi:hypothetical protein
MTLRSAIPLLFCFVLSACSGGGADLPTQPLATISTDRAGLAALVPAYLAALIEHDTSWVPLADNAVLVENAQALKAGEGLWQTASGAGAFRIVVADPASGQVGAIARLEENGMPIALGLRLGVQNGRVIAMEHVIVRDLSEDALENLETPRAGFTTEIPEAQRLSRDELLHTAFKYYDALDSNDGSLAPFADDCVRHENGLQTSLNQAGEAATGFEEIFGSLGCAAQLDTGGMAYVDLIDNRRVTIADPVTGTVFGLAQFRHSMMEKKIPVIGVNGISERTVDFEPFDLLTAHVFKVGPDKAIHEIETVGAKLPYKSSTGWGW